MRIFRDTVCKQHEYQNMAPKNNPCGVSTLQKQKLLQPRPQAISFPEPQSRSPSLRSLGRKRRLWDNPLPEAKNPG